LATASATTSMAATTRLRRSRQRRSSWRRPQHRTTTFARRSLSATRSVLRRTRSRLTAASGRGITSCSVSKRTLLPPLSRVCVLCVCEGETKRERGEQRLTWATRTQPGRKGTYAHASALHPSSFLFSLTPFSFFPDLPTVLAGGASARSCLLLPLLLLLLFCSVVAHHL
jgi:hypothetical protein